MLSIDFAYATGEKATLQTRPRQKPARYMEWGLGEREREGQAVPVLPGTHALSLLNLMNVPLSQSKELVVMSIYPPEPLPNQKRINLVLVFFFASFFSLLEWHLAGDAHVAVN